MNIAIMKGKIKELVKLIPKEERAIRGICFTDYTGGINLWYNLVHGDFEFSTAPQTGGSTRRYFLWVEGNDNLGVPIEQRQTVFTHDNDFNDAYNELCNKLIAIFYGNKTKNTTTAELSNNTNAVA